MAGTLPVLPVKDVSAVVDWYVKVLGFNKLFEQPMPDGTVVAGQVEKQGSNIMFNLNPKEADLRGGGIYLWIRVEETDLDNFYQSLVKQGFEMVEPLKDGFWGDRYFAVRDLNGYILAFNKMKG
jgi:PhnB protein